MNPETFVMLTIALSALVVVWVIVKLSNPSPSLYSMRAAAVLFLGVLMIMMLVSLAIELDRWEESNATTVVELQ